MKRALFLLVTAHLGLGCGGTQTLPTEEPTDASVDGDGAPVDTSAVGTLGAPCDKPGALACAGHAQKLQLLCDGGVWKSNGVCPGDLICDTRPGPTAGSCQPPEPGCVGKTPGESICDGAIRRTCGPDLITSTANPCGSPELCKSSTGPTCAKCIDGKFRCTGAILEKCKADHTDFEKVDTCATEALCVDVYGKCLAPRCAVGDYQCDGNTLQTCKASRIDWDTVKICPDGMCDAATKSCRECVPGTKDCAAGNTPRSCDTTGHWVSLTPCASPTPLCKAGVCSVGACVTGEYRCSVDTLETCNSTLDGFDPVKVCAAGLCDVVGKECDDCKSGAADCVGSTPRACDSTGHWKSLTPCSGSTPYCKAGVCSVGACVLGEYRCTGDALETCNSTASGWDPVKTCGAGLCDAAGKECDECKSGDKTCVGTTPRTCDTTGHWKDLTVCSGSTPICWSGACIPGWTVLTSLTAMGAGMSDYVPVGEGGPYVKGGSVAFRRYDPSASSFSTLSDPSSWQSWNTFVHYGGALYLFSVTTVQKYDVSAGTWSSYATGLTSMSTNMTVHDDAGNAWTLTSEFPPRILKFDIVAKTATYVSSTGIASQNEPRVAWDSIAKRLYVGPKYNSGAFFVFDPSTGFATALTSHPEGYMNHIFCSDRSGHLYAAGIDSTPRTMWQYTIATDKWSRMPDLPFDKGTDGACTVSGDGYLYVSSGSTGNFGRFAVK